MDCFPDKYDKEIQWIWELFHMAGQVVFHRQKMWYFLTQMFFATLMWLLVVPFTPTGVNATILNLNGTPEMWRQYR